MSRLIRIIAHSTDGGVRLDVLTADGKESVSFVHGGLDTGHALRVANNCLDNFLRGFGQQLPHGATLQPTTAREES